MTLKIENNGYTNKKCNKSNYNKLDMFEAIDASNQILVGLFGIEQ